MVMIEGALITCGIMISYWIDLGLSFAPGSVAWRFPLAFQVFFCIIILVFIPFLPESPRWLILKGREAEAKEVIAALEDADVTDHAVENEFLAIKETVLEMSKGTFRDLFAMDKNRNLHRTLLAYFNQVFQQISGINLITYYAAVIYRGLGMSDFLSRLLAALNGTEYFLASWPAVFLVERVGRRKLMLFGGIGQAATMAILAGVNSRQETGYQIAGIVFLFVFNTFFAIGWLGMTWLYPAEIVPLRIRAPANALSTSANWIFNFLVVMITPVAFNNIGYQTYIIFAVINAFMVPCVYFFYPRRRTARSRRWITYSTRWTRGGKGCLRWFIRRGLSRGGMARTGSCWWTMRRRRSIGGMCSRRVCWRRRGRGAGKGRAVVRARVGM
jgi:sugar porter (SP) family MFS transporter